MYIKLENSKRLVNGFVFLDKDKNILDVNYSNLTHTNATSQNSQSAYDAMFKSTGTSSSPPLAPLNTPIIHIVNISNVINQLHYIRVIGSGTSDTWGGLLTISFSMDNLAYENEPNYTNYQMQTKAFDVVDINVNQHIIKSRAIVKNQSTNQHYSLENQTLIHLPNVSSKNMILHGIEAGEEIHLDLAFNKMKYVENTNEVLGEGKIFSHAIDMNKTKIKKLIL